MYDVWTTYTIMFIYIYDFIIICYTSNVDNHVFYKMPGQCTECQMWKTGNYVKNNNIWIEI